LPDAHSAWYSGIVAMNVYQAVKQAMQDLVAPQIESLRGDIAGLRGEMNGLRSEIRGELSGLRGEMNGIHGEMNGIRAEMNGIRAEIHALDERLTIALDVRERIVALEARLRN
jgi:chromosome segregation ATPase